MAGLLYEYIFDPSRKPKTIKEAIEELDRGRWHVLNE